MARNRVVEGGVLMPKLRKKSNGSCIKYEEEEESLKSISAWGGRCGHINFHK